MDAPQVSFLSVLMCWWLSTYFHLETMRRFPPETRLSLKHTHSSVLIGNYSSSFFFFLIILPSLCLYSAGSKYLHWRTCSSEDHQTWARWVWSHSVVLKEVWCEACGEAHMTHPVLFLPVQHEREINDCSDWCTWTLLDGHTISVSRTICIF